MEQTFVQARVQCLEFSNGRIRVARSGQDRELRWFLAAVTVVSIVALYYLQLDWLKLISRLPDLGKTFGLLALLDFHDFGLTLEAFSQTVAITVLATIYSVLLGLVLAAFGARNLMKNKFVTYALSAFFTFLRAVPTPVWVLLALVCLGLGPAAGIVGLCVHATAFFARAFTQSFEDVPEEVIEALEATGASNGSMLRELAQPLAEKYGVSVVKAPAKTLAMIKLREPVKNSLFYLGEALVCDTVVELGGTKGTAVVMGDDFDKVSSMAVIDAAFNRQVSELDELKTVLQRLSMRQQREQELENGLYAKTMVDFQTMDQE